MSNEKAIPTATATGKTFSLFSVTSTTVIAFEDLIATAIGVWEERGEEKATALVDLAPTVSERVKTMKNLSSETARTQTWSVIYVHPKVQASEPNDSKQEREKRAGMIGEKLGGVASKFGVQFVGDEGMTKGKRIRLLPAVEIDETCKSEWCFTLYSLLGCQSTLVCVVT